MTGPAGEFVLLAYGRSTPLAYEAHTPLSLFSIGACLEAAGLRVEYFDERVEPRRRFDELLARRPLAVGFSVMGGFQILSSLSLSRRARERSPRSRIVWGGLFPSSLPQELAGEGSVDFLVLGEAEETMRELCAALSAGGGDFSGIRGLAWRDGARLTVNPWRPPPDLETLPFPYHERTLPLLRRYLGRPARREAAGYEASRGCPFRCGFCYSPAFHGPVRVKSPAKLRRELALLRGLGVSSVDVYDDVLTGGSADRAGELAGLLLESGLSWMANLRVEMVSPGLLSRLEASGCRWLYFGLESGDDRTLRRLGKGFSSAQARRALGLLGGSRMGLVFSIIAGLPGEAAIGPALDLAEEVHGLIPAAEIQVQSFLPLPNSALYGEALAGGFSPPAGLRGWAGHEHLSVALPWLADPALPAKAYLASFLAFRYKRHLARFPFSLLAYPLHRLSLWRIRRRCFRFYFEGLLYAGAAAWARWLAAPRLAWDGGRRPGG